MSKVFGSGRHWALPTSRVGESASDGFEEMDRIQADTESSSHGVLALFNSNEAVTNVRALPAMGGDDGTDLHGVDCPRSTALVLPSERLRSTRTRATLSTLGLPEYLTPSDGGLYSLLSLLDSLPVPHVPVLRPGDEVLVVTLGVDNSERDEVAHMVESELADVGRPLDLASLRIEPWPEDLDGREEKQALSEIVSMVAETRPRLVMLHTTPDCTPTRAYLACRSVPGVQLDLWGAIDAVRPAALSWGAPVAFVDGRASSPDLWAAVCMNRLAGRAGRKR